MSEKIGIIGLGNMGLPIALSAIKAGLDVTVFDVRKEPMAECVQAGGNAGTDAADLAARCSLISVVLVDDAAVSELVTDLLPRCSPGTVVVIHSTVLPETILRLAKRAAEHDVSLVDAQVSGGEERARIGDLAVMVGGQEKDVRRCDDYFAAISRCATHLGDTGSGASAKLAVQIMCFCNQLAAMEAVRISTAYGIDEDRFVEFARETVADSWVMRVWGKYDGLMLHHTLAGSDALYRFFDKDLHYAVLAGRDAGVSVPITAVAAQLLESSFKQRLAESAVHTAP